ncbi:Uncharacterized protein dnl_51630 [Desulfonema limicola]|uniref:Uncharacterized protein n=1 Tax=Desulfonema limicola TaxID=45656 RepID=A0A975BCP4_9BACT|nr:hypothetical protein [Desulfonema limicola]QTA82779.1 Uncharacterized protein dnl_51630 [Desulfonema limicola]
MKPEIRALGIVLIGAFNPKIFHPYWMKSVGLLTDTEAGDSNVELSNNDISIFSTDWMRFEVTQQRLTIVSEQHPYFDRILDLTCETFRMLRHTPIYVIGINHHYHYKFNSEDEWHKIGHTLAPKDCWSKIFKQPGMQRIEIVSPREDNYKGQLLVRCENSKRFFPGIQIHLNDHYEIGEPKEIISADSMVEILEKQYSFSYKKSQEVADVLLSCAERD